MDDGIEGSYEQFATLGDLHNTPSIEAHPKLISSTAVAQEGFQLDMDCIESEIGRQGHGNAVHNEIFPLGAGRDVGESGAIELRTNSANIDRSIASMVYRSVHQQYTATSGIVSLEQESRSSSSNEIFPPSKKVKRSNKSVDDDSGCSSLLNT